ncbi:unnamed protein product [Echinostoma caproni]|uniref:Ovule protein n=1 Tax=Echinostoma caproni TaxID=27848 RepID=A0A183A9E9_9TREM|nr:unnamed protein product [Echinostoma caproni]
MRLVMSMKNHKKSSGFCEDYCLKLGPSLRKRVTMSLEFENLMKALNGDTSSLMIDLADVDIQIPLILTWRLIITADLPC